MSLFAPVEPHPLFLFANLDDSSIRHRVQLVLRDNQGHQGALELDLTAVPTLPDGKTWDQFQHAYVSNDTGDAQHQAFGRHLFAALFGNAAMRETWQGIHSASSAARQPLALTAIFGPGTERLARLPLELLHDDAGFLFARPGSAVRRCFARMRPRAFEHPPQPRLLFAWACPPGAGDPFDPVPHEEALRGLFGDRLTVCPQASLDGIGHALATTPCHFVHILAHGFRDEDLGGIALHGAQGELDLVDAQRLANTLQRRDIRLAFLCSCRTAQVTAHMLSGVAQQLLAPSGADLPAVVATQANLPVRGSALLAGQFYELLLHQRQDPAAALARARVKAYQDGTGAWSVPVFLGRPPVLAEPRPTPVATAALPPRRATFLERPREMAEILDKLRGHRLVSIVGLPGIGKTELGLETTRRLLTDGFQLRLVFCKVERTFNPGILRGLISARLGLEKPLETDEALASALAEPATLLLLDNAEDMMADEHSQSAFREQLDVWLAGASSLVVLLTTRWPVGCTREREIQVDIPPLSPEQTERLLLAELRAIDTWREEWSQQPEWRRLLGFLDGHPRSIWLVSHHFEGRNPSLSRIVERLERLKAHAIADPALIGRADVFEALSSAGQDRMRSLVASIDFSFDVLGQRHPDAAEAFLALSLFPAGLPEPVALAVTGGPDSLALDHLYRYHLLEWNRERTFYPVPLHWYAEHRRQRAALARDAYFARALPAYADYIEQCNQGVIRDQSPVWTERWLLEEDTLLALSGWAVAQETPPLEDSTLARVASAGMNTLKLLDRLESGRILAEQGLCDAKRRRDRGGEANCQKALGDLALRQDDLAAADRHYQAALPLFRAIQARLGEANCLQALGDLALRQDDLAAADRHYQAALPLYRAIQDRLGEANCQKALGDLALRQDDLAAADRHYQAALPLFRAIQARLGEANCLQALGDLARRQDDLAAADRHYQAALPLFRAIQARLGEANCLQALGDLARRQDDLAAADRHYQAALPLFRAIQDRLGEANCQKALGDLALRQDDLAAADRHYQAALPLFRAIQDRLGEANCQKALGDLALRQDDLAAADRHYQAALPLFRAIQARLGEANCLQALGDLALRQDDLAAADRHYQAALPLFRAIQDRLGEANCLQALGDLALRQDDLAAADRHYQAALPLYRAIQARLGEANCLQALGLLLLARNEPATAFGRFLEVLVVFQEIQDDLDAQAALGYLARTAATAGHADQALVLAERSRQIGRAIDDRFGQLINLKLQISLLGNAENMEALLAAALLHQQLAVAIQDQNEIERYRPGLEQIRQEIPAEAWEQLEQNAEALLAQAVAAAEQRLGGRDPLVWVEDSGPTS